MDDMNDSFRSLSSLSVGRTISVARHLSIELRKLLLDGQPLFHFVVYPTFESSQPRVSW